MNSQSQQDKKLWQFWIDRGGTFTDIVGCNPDGEILIHKLLSENPNQYADAAIQGIRDLLKLTHKDAIPMAQIGVIKMGTTVATNALLERQGEKTLLAITEGFGDILRIGYQNRPKLFAIDILLPEMLYSDVIEIDERLDSHGCVIKPLDEKTTETQLQKYFIDGYRTLAIVLMHGYRYSEHEKKIAAIARRVGFTQISISHQVSPLMKIIPRGDTTVLDAYLSPILRHYISQVENALGREAEQTGRLMFMQSNGGLTDARFFAGKDAILSGPAGGVVGMVKTANAAGFNELIGFDMGGTSTDVSHFSGDYERAFETEVAGIRCCAPMMLIHTVAAGGGSILHFDGSRYRVGPDSAGANPGPTCYRNGGPLTITDCNVMLGKLDPDFFPKVFGPKADQPLDSEIVREKFNDLTKKIENATGKTITPQEVAEGFLSIAIDNMSNAIKKISVQRGHDVSDYTLSCFGGAGAQHACLVADNLGMKQIHLHPFAGVLSAFGIGLADTRTINDMAIEAQLDQQLLTTISLELETLKQRGAEDLLAQGLNISTLAHHQRVRQVVMAGNIHKVCFYDRQQIPINIEIIGPAIIIEQASTIVIEPGWRAQLSSNNDLILERIEPLERQNAIGTNVDPVMLEIFNNLFMNIAEQMGTVLENTAASVNIKERLDFSCAIFTPEGELVANAPHIPVHLGSMSESIKTIIRENSSSMKSGDAFLMNAPYNGGTHLPDITLIKPVYDEKNSKVIFYVANRGHHADIGGMTPGSAPANSTHVNEEGVLIDNFKLVSSGKFLESEIHQLLSSGPYPCRNIKQNIADLKAQVAATEKGAKELIVIIKRYGLDVVHAYMQHVQDNAEESVRRILDVLEDTSFTYKMDDGHQVSVAIRVDKIKRCATIDFTGTSSQHPGNYNAPIAICYAAVLYVFRCLIDEDIPLNNGCFKPLNIIVPEKSMINPVYPAAVVAGNVETSQYIVDALFGALGKMAASQGTMNNYIWGNDRIQNYETICGGSGASDKQNGCSAVQTHMTNTRLTDPEVLEWRFPVRLETFRIRKNSGGRGQHKGGEGVDRQMRFLEPMTVNMIAGHRIEPPYGIAGGEPGAVGENYVVHSDHKLTDLGTKGQVEVNKNDIFILKTPGGGGYGHPD